MCFHGVCDGTGVGPREVLSRNRESNFILHSSAEREEEKKGKKEQKKRRRRKLRASVL